MSSSLLELSPFVPRSIWSALERIAYGAVRAPYRGRIDVSAPASNLFDCIAIIAVHGEAATSLAAGLQSQNGTTFHFKSFVQHVLETSKKQQVQGVIESVRWCLSHFPIDVGTGCRQDIWIQSRAMQLSMNVHKSKGRKTYLQRNCANSNVGCPINKRTMTHRSRLLLECQQAMIARWESFVCGRIEGGQFRCHIRPSATDVLSTGRRLPVLGNIRLPVTSTNAASQLSAVPRL